MAVQAQYPANVLLLNRDGQERKDMIGGGDYSLQSQAGEILHHPQMLYRNGAGMNPRKRVRETETETPVNLFQLQSQPPTLVNLAQLHNRLPSMVSTGLRLAVEDHHQQQQQQQQMGFFLPSSILPSFLSEDLSAQMKHQKDEIDQFLQTQGEQLRRTLADRREMHYRALLVAAEESASRRMREKEAEMEKAARRNAELEARVAQVKGEAQVWQARAMAQEASVVSLQVQLQQAMMGGGAQDKREELGCAGGEMFPADDAESAHIDPGRVVPVVPLCRVCRNRAVSVVFLPCRHLCLCKECDTAVDACPLCHGGRSASVEVYLS